MNYDFIAIADLHLRLTNPVNRIDDYLGSMKTKLKYLTQLQVDHNGIPVVIAGDIFDNWNANARLINFAFDTLPINMYAVAGNHDLSGNNYSYVDETAYGVLCRAHKIVSLEDHIVEEYGFSISGMKFNGSPLEVDTDVLVWHTPIMKDSVPFMESMTPPEIAEMFPEVKVIVTGDIHTPLVQNFDDLPLVVNPGSMMRSSISQKDHLPRVYLVNIENKIADPVYFPIEENVWKAKPTFEVDRDISELEAAVAGYEGKEVDFDIVLRNLLSKNKTKTNVKNYIGDLVSKLGEKNDKN